MTLAEIYELNKDKLINGSKLKSYDLNLKDWVITKIEEANLGQDRLISDKPNPSTVAKRTITGTLQAVDGVADSDLVTISQYKSLKKSLEDSISTESNNRATLTNSLIEGTIIVGEAKKVSNTLSIKLGTGSANNYNGSSTLSLSITPSSIGASPSNHNHKSITLTLNGSSKSYDGSSDLSLGNIYSPTSPGASGYRLKSNGSGAPNWHKPYMDILYEHTAGSNGGTSYVDVNDYDNGNDYEIMLFVIYDNNNYHYSYVWWSPKIPLANASNYNETYIASGTILYTYGISPKDAETGGATSSNTKILRFYPTCYKLDISNQTRVSITSGIFINRVIGFRK